LFTNENLTAEGFPLAVSINHQSKRKRKNIAFCHEKHFIQDGKTISEKHPDYDILAPILMNIKIKARKIILSQCKDVNVAFELLFAIDFSQIGFLDYARNLFISLPKTLFQKTE
jgi:hypothetical protein